MRPLREWPIRAKMSVTAMLVTGLMAAALYALLLTMVRQRAFDQAQTRADQLVERVVKHLETDRSPPALDSGPEEIVQVVDPFGKVIGSSAALRGRRPMPVREPGLLATRADSRFCGYPAPGSPCMLASTMRVYLSGKPYTISAAVPEPGLLPEPRWAAVFGIAAVAVTALRGITMWRTVGRILAPVDAIRREMDQIVTTTDLHRQVPVPAVHDEIRRLAMSVNATLSRLERAVEQQRRFVSDVSHELRSPITGLQAGLEEAVRYPDEVDPVIAIGAALAATERLQNIVADLLVLARREAGIPVETQLLDLTVVVKEEVARRARRVPISIEAPSADVTVLGSPVGISRVITNLLDNAARHAASAVDVRILLREPYAVVEVHDDGEGIPPHAREQVFERFVRLAEGRRRDPGGSGLGLAISREIVRDHHGTLTIADRGPGTCFVLSLPANGRS